MGLFLFLACLIGWFMVFKWFQKNRSFSRLGGLLLMTFLTYASFEIVLWSFQVPLKYMMVIGMAPIIVVAYGFRYYDYHYRTEQKPKNQEKKHPEPMTE